MGECGYSSLQTGLRPRDIAARGRLVRRVSRGQSPVRRSKPARGRSWSDARFAHYRWRTGVRSKKLEIPLESRLQGILGVRCARHLVQLGEEECLVMRERVQSDRPGDLLAQWISEQNELGLSKTEAKDLLTALMQEYKNIVRKPLRLKRWRSISPACS